jgi:hypothetical protein
VVVSGEELLKSEGRRVIGILQKHILHVLRHLRRQLGIRIQIGLKACTFGAYGLRNEVSVLDGVTIQTVVLWGSAIAFPL